MNENPTNALSPTETEVDSSTGAIRKVTKSIKTTVSQLFTPTKKFDTSKVPDAYQAFLKSKYGSVDDNEQRLNYFMSKVSELIASKNQNNEYALVQVIPEDIEEYTDTIVEFFTRKGYVTKELSSIINGLSNHYLFIAFDNFKLVQESLKKQSSSEQPN